MTIFSDRREAGQQLANELAQHSLSDPIVYALPRGGVTVGDEIARALGAQLSIIIARKIGHPAWEEYAIGAVTETGEPVLNETEVEQLDAKWLQQAIERERTESKRRRETYVNGEIPSAAGKTAIIVDDGVATGLTLEAAVKEIREHGPRELIVAVPVAPAETVRRIGEDVDAFVTVIADEHYRGAVGAYYEQFDQVEDDEVIEILSRQRT